MRSYIASFLLASVASAASVFTVEIGEGGLKFVPDTVTASQGDVIRFMWSGGVTHNVVSGPFSKPCTPDGLIASPKQSAGQQDFFVQINSTDPIFMYCSVFDHCNEGMVMAVNPSSSETLDTYMSGAQNAAVAQPSATPVGGILAASTATPFAGATAAASMTSGSMSSAAATGAMTSSSSTGNAAALATGAPAAVVGAAAIGFAAMLL